MKTEVKFRKHKSDKDPLIFTYDFGDSIEDAIAKFDGEGALNKVVHQLFITAVKQQLVEEVRKKMFPEPGKSNEIPEPFTQEKMQAFLDSWKPQVQRRIKANVAKVSKLLAGLSLEELEALGLPGTFAAAPAEADSADFADTEESADSANEDADD